MPLSPTALISKFYEPWEEIVLGADYPSAFIDSITRPYVPVEHRHCFVIFAYPAQLAGQIQELKSRVKTFEHCMGAIRQITGMVVM